MKAWCYLLSGSFTDQFRQYLSNCIRGRCKVLAPVQFHLPQQESSASRVAISQMVWS